MKKCSDKKELKKYPNQLIDKLLIPEHFRNKSEQSMRIQLKFELLPEQKMFRYRNKMCSAKTSFSVLKMRFVFRFVPILFRSNCSHLNDFESKNENLTLFKANKSGTLFRKLLWRISGVI